VINQFLATLDNIPSAPSQFIWPTFTARSVGAVEAQCRAAVIGTNLAREAQFARCLQLVNLVGETPLAPYLTSTDHRLTYTSQTIRNRFALAGLIIQATSSPSPTTQLSFIVLANTPDIGSWTLSMSDSTHVVVTDDFGTTVTRAITFGSGVSSVFSDAAGVAHFQFTGVGPSAGNAWAVTYQRPGSSWIQSALARSETLNPQQLMSRDLLTWYTAAPTAIDRLAAIVATLGTMPS
jgi:hypothetical protein